MGHTHTHLITIIMTSHMLMGVPAPGSPQFKLTRTPPILPRL